MLIPLLYDDIYAIPGREVYIFMTGCVMNYIYDRLCDELLTAIIVSLNYSITYLTYKP